MKEKASGNFLQIPANHCDARAFYTTAFTEGGEKNTTYHFMGKKILTGV